MGIPVNPNHNPGGGSFPVFSGNSVPSVKPYKVGPQDWMVVAQFDFSSPNGFTTLTDSAGNSVKAFYVDFSSLVQNVVLPRFKSLFISVDFDPTFSLNGPYKPLQIADNSVGQLIYLGGFDSAAQSLDTKGGKTTACIPLLCQPGNVWMFSKYADFGPSFLGVGVAIFTTWEVPPFRSIAQG